MEAAVVVACRENSNPPRSLTQPSNHIHKTHKHIPTKKGTHHCSWPGVICDSLSGRVVELSLGNDAPAAPEARLDGALDGFAELRALARVALHHNALRGTLPPEWGRLPRLASVGAGYNRLTGTLPPEWATGAASITSVNLTGNPLRGGVPQEWTSYYSPWGSYYEPSWALQHLECRACGLNAALPAEWRLLSLSTLDLSDNPIPGPFRQVVDTTGGYGGRLATLRLANTSLNDTLDYYWRFSGLSHLEVVDLSGNPGINGLLESGEQKWVLPRALLLLCLLARLRRRRRRRRR